MQFIRFLILIGIPLLVSACSFASEEAIKQNSSMSALSSAQSFSISSIASISQLSNDCFSYLSSSILNTDEGQYWETKFAELFPQVVASSSFDSLWAADRSCAVSEQRQLVTFVYRSKNFSQLHSIIALFDKDLHLLNYSDISCDFIDDIGGVKFIEESNNHLLVQCQTSGLTEKGSTSITQLVSINLQDFSTQSFERIIR